MSDSLRFAAMVAGATAFCGLSSPAAAGGYALEQQNARALGAAFAGAQARRADPGFAAYNPAAIAGVGGPDLSVNATGVWSVTSYEGAQGALLGVAPITGAARGEGFDRAAIIPNFSVAAPLGDRVFIGLTLNSPFGLKTVFDESSILRYQARKSQALSVSAAPTLAIQVTDAFAVGGAVRIQYVDLSVTATIDAGGVAAANSVPGFAPGSSDLFAAFDGDDIEVGFAAGFQAALGPRLVLGGAYSSKITHEVAGDASFDLAASPAGQALNAAAGLFAPTKFATDFVTPAIAGFGLEYAAAERITLIASATWSLWSEFDRVALVFDNPAQPPEILIQNWRDSWTLSVGGEYALREETTVRAGFMFDKTPARDAFASPRIPDSDRYWATLGVSEAFSDRLSADLGLAVAFFEDRPIRLLGAAPEDFLRGSLSTTLATTAFAVSGRLRYSF